MAKRSRPRQTSKKGKAKGKIRKERGTLLTIALVIVALHGVFATYLYYTLRTQQAYLERPWILTLMVVHSALNVAAAVGIWYWKKWALYVYAASAVIALVVGLLSVGIWSVFYMVLPVAILGWLLRTKWGYFE